MERVEPNRNLTRWEEPKVSPITPADVFKILKEWKDNDAFDRYHIGAICQDIARSLTDKLETPEGGEILYFNYDRSKGDTYRQTEILEKMFGERIATFDEMRDGSGYLRQFRVVLKGETK